MSEEGIDLGPLAVVPTFALTFGAPVAALQHQAGTGLKLMAEGAAETEFTPPVALHHGRRKALAAPELSSTFHIFQIQFVLRLALVIAVVNEYYLIFRTLLLQGGGDGFELAFINYTLRVLKPNLPNYGNPARERYVLTFLMYGSIHIIIDWIESNYDLTAREIAKLIFDLCDSVKA